MNQPVGMAGSRIRVRSVGARGFLQTPAPGGIPVGPRHLGQEGGRISLSYSEALELQGALGTVIEEIEAVGPEKLDVDCARALIAGPFPLAKSLQARLDMWAPMAKTTDVFELTRGEAEVATKTAECAAELSRIQVARTAGVVVIGGGAAAALLLLLL